MKRTFIIDGERVQVSIRRMQTRSELIDVTPFGSDWREIIDSGNSTIDLQGMTDDGKQIDGLFCILDRLEGGTLVLESIR